MSAMKLFITLFIRKQIKIYINTYTIKNQNVEDISPENNKNVVMVTLDSSQKDLRK